jgi:hypothetical protein
VMAFQKRLLLGNGMLWLADALCNSEAHDRMCNLRLKISE